MRSSASAKTRFMASAQASTRVGILSHSGSVAVGALCLLALVVMVMGLATAFELTRELPRLGLLAVGDGHIVMLDPDGAAAQAGLRLGDHLAAVDGLGFSSHSLGAVGAHPLGDLVDVTVGAPGSYTLFRIPAAAPSATELAGDVAALAAALALWLSGLAIGLLRRRVVAARLYAAAAILLALALYALVANGMGLAWAAPALLPAAFLGLGFVALAQGALCRRNGWPLVAMVLLVCGVPAVAALLDGAVPLVGSVDALFVLLALASLLVVAAPWYWHARAAAEPERRRLRVAGLAVLAGLLPIWLWPGVTVIAALHGRAVAVPAAWHLSALWGACSLALMAVLFGALLLSPETGRLDTRLRRAGSYVAAATLTFACWLAVRAYLTPLAQVALAVVLALLNPAIQRWLDQALARAVHARTPDYARAERLIEEMTMQADSTGILAATLVRELPDVLGLPAAVILLRDHDGSAREYKAFLAGAREAAGCAVAPLPEVVLSAPGPVWSPGETEPAQQGALGQIEPALWAPLRWDGAVQAMLGLGPCSRGEVDLDQISRLARLLALALNTKLLVTNLHERTRALVGLTHRLSHAHEQERANLSRELHDVVAQELIALTRHLRRYGEDHPPPPAIWADMLAGAQDALVATRRICNGLRPAILDLGLAPALRDLVAAVSDEQAAPQVMLSVNGPEQRWPADLEFALFRVAQEGLNNALVHAQARQIQIALDFQDGLRLYVRDDGRGFTVPARFEDLPGDHLGLIGMRERVAEFDGTLTVTSSPGRGTTLEVRLPPRNT